MTKAPTKLRGTKDILIKKTEPVKKVFGGLEITEDKPKTVRGKLARFKEKQRTAIERAKIPEEKIFRGTVVLGILGAVRGVVGAVEFI